MEKLLTSTETAALLRIGRSTLYRLVKRRQIPVIRVGTRCLFPQARLEEWIHDRTVPPEAVSHG